MINKICKECYIAFGAKENVRKFCSRSCFHLNYGKNHRAENHHKWQGDGAGYFAIHLWLNKWYPHGKVCENCGLSGKLHWALLKDKNYKRQRENFIELCPSCHKKYDMTDEIREKMSKSKKGKPSNRKKAE